VRSHLAGELTLQRSLEGHHKDRLEGQLRELKEELRGTVQRGDARFKQLSLEKAELEAANMIMREQLEEVKAVRDRETAERDREMRTLRETTSSSSEQLRQAKEEIEERMQEVTRAKMQAESEFDKERALFD
jgi:chromosome segregation ATPase